MRFVLAVPVLGMWAVIFKTASDLGAQDRTRVSLMPQGSLIQLIFLNKHSLDCLKPWLVSSILKKLIMTGFSCFCGGVDFWGSLCHHFANITSSTYLLLQLLLGYLYLYNSSEFLVDSL